MPLRWTEGKQLKILDFDCESRPLTFQGDWNTSEITAIGASWIGEKKIHCWALGEVDSVEMLSRFREMYAQADILTGHYIRGFDLPLVNGALLEFKLPLLTSKLTQDTCKDLTRKKDLSGSQESLGQMFGLSHPKEHMSPPLWRKANRLTQEGIKETRRRVIGDVRQHKQLREHLLAIRALKPPKVWNP